MWGAKIKMPCDLPDDVLRDAIDTSNAVLEKEEQTTNDFEKYGLDCAASIKEQFDARWKPNWHCVIGRSFGSFVTHEMKKFAFFYLGDKAILLFKA